MAGASLRVLLVEDEILIRWSIAETLASSGHTVIEAESGREALDHLERQPPEPFDVVLLDYRLPDSNDLQLLAAIRRLRPETAVVMMTAFGTPEIMARALELGAYRVLGKPFDVHALEPLLLEAHGARPH